WALGVFLLALLAAQQCPSAAGARILAAFFYPCKSHFMMTNAVIRELVKRGHEVTFITPFSLASENLGSNYKEIVLPHYDFWTEMKRMSNREIILDMADLSTLKFVRMLHVMGVQSTDFAFEQPEIKALINAKNKVGKYDLLIAEQFYNEGALILGHLYQTPTITLSSFGNTNYFSEMVGIITPWSYNPHSFISSTTRMNLWERAVNVFVCGMEHLMRTFLYYPSHDAVLRKHFSGLLDVVPTTKQLERNISAILMNNYMPLDAPRPISFNMISVGGLHIQPPKALPVHLQKFLDEAKHGAIYFSLGTQVRSADLPAEKLKVFLDAFRSLKQRVLWKFEEDSFAELPANVMIQKWLPQADILAHPNVKVFIAHGGLFGMQEALHYGVPVLGMPVYCDQHFNINQGKANGYAIGLDYRTITTEQLRSALLELLENPKYRDTMKRSSRIFRQRPLGAMDTAMFWIDYVIEHRGAPHMVSAGMDLAWYQFYLLDIVAIAAAALLLPILILCVCLRNSKLKPKTKRKQH
ncbi:PREDICTED: UDP-glucuronosyltransferase 2C1, partial [Drosophila arizonae]|uniref:UDP-glucuronosyltransferase n=1 Tax=Drosophila arizonae TaxID=7263 RepID=A0ABM1Q5E3_DROAR